MLRAELTQPARTIASSILKLMESAPYNHYEPRNCRGVLSATTLLLRTFLHLPSALVTATTVEEQEQREVDCPFIIANLSDLLKTTRPNQ